MEMAAGIAITIGIAGAISMMIEEDDELRRVSSTRTGTNTVATVIHAIGRYA